MNHTEVVLTGGQKSRTDFIFMTAEVVYLRYFLFLWVIEESLYYIKVLKISALH